MSMSEWIDRFEADLETDRIAGAVRREIPAPWIQGVALGDGVGTGSAKRFDPGICGSGFAFIKLRVAKARLRDRSPA